MLFVISAHIQGDALKMSTSDTSESAGPRTWGFFFIKSTKAHNYFQDCIFPKSELLVERRASPVLRRGKHVQEAELGSSLFNH